MTARRAITGMNPIRTFLFALLATFVASVAPAQICYGFGSHFVGATIEASPTVLDCALAPTWPDWHLFTPAHREPGPHPGFNPGDASELPRILVAYKCTGWLLLPVVPRQIKKMGYVIDQPEIACSVSS